MLLQKEDSLANRPILHQMVALYDYTAQGPEDLEFSEGDTIDILGEGEALQGKLKLHVHVMELLPVCSSASLHVSLPPLLVNEVWLEGHSAGHIGIFPGCFAYRENADIAQCSGL